MKLSLQFFFATAFAASTTVSAFAPISVSRVASPVTSSAKVAPSSKTELGLFFRKAKATAEAEPITEEEVRSMFSLWNNALATGDSRLVAKRYAEDAVLLPTVSDVPRTDYALIKDYFDNFLLKKPQGKILDGKIKIGHNWAQVRMLCSRSSNSVSWMPHCFPFLTSSEHPNCVSSGRWNLRVHYGSRW